MKKTFNILPSSAVRYKVHGYPVDKKDLIKLRTICTAKESIKQIKRKPIIGETLCQLYSYHKIIVQYI